MAELNKSVADYLPVGLNSESTEILNSTIATLCGTKSVDLETVVTILTDTHFVFLHFLFFFTSNLAQPRF